MQVAWRRLAAKLAGAHASRVAEASAV